VTTALAEQDTQVANFDISEAAISELSEKYYDLSISGIDDKAGFDAVHKARMHIKDLRTQVTKKHRLLKAPVLERGRAIDAEAKRIKLLLLPVYQRLETEEFAVIKERERLAMIAAEKKAAELRRRFAAMHAVEWVAPVDTIEPMTDEEFLAAWTIAKKAYDTKKAAEAKQAADLAAKQADLDRRERELKDAEERLFPKTAASPPDQPAINASDPNASKQIEPAKTTDREMVEAYAYAVSGIPLPGLSDASLDQRLFQITKTFIDSLSGLFTEL
jgi:hypothetical protein